MNERYSFIIFIFKGEIKMKRTKKNIAMVLLAFGLVFGTASYYDPNTVYASNQSVLGVVKPSNKIPIYATNGSYIIKEIAKLIGTEDLDVWSQAITDSRHKMSFKNSYNGSSGCIIMNRTDVKRDFDIWKIESIYIKTNKGIFKSGDGSELGNQLEVLRHKVFFLFK